MSDDIKRRMKELEQEDYELDEEFRIRNLQKNIKQKRNELNHPNQSKAIGFLKGRASNTIENLKRWRDQRRQSVFK